MPLLLRNLTLAIEEDENILLKKLTDRFSLCKGDVLSFFIVRKGLDARKKSRLRFVYTVQFTLEDEKGFWERNCRDADLELVPGKREPEFQKLATDVRIIVVGMGPAGLFAALRLSEYGLSPMLLERGKPVSLRVRDVESFWERGVLDPESNVQFGEGGAGTFSDGKLTTRLKDENIDYVLRKLVQFGAPPEIRYLAKPHIGTDRLRGVVTGIRCYLESRGIEIRFQSKLTDILVSSGKLRGVLINDRVEERCDFMVLAPGHSARDTYEMLMRRTVKLEPKPFAVGVRVEHPQELVNRIQYGIPSHLGLPPAEYALAYNNNRSGRSAYSFCMCPGGMVVAGSSEECGVATNGMSSYLRSSPYANSALVINVGKDDFPGESPLAGVEFQRLLEKRAYLAGGGDYRAPAQNLLAFLGSKGVHKVASTYRPGVRESDLSQVFPFFVTDTLREGLRFFDRKMRGFITAEATLIGVETRTSAPVRMVRGEDLQSVSLPGLYPVGEGAGYAGGIMSAALDGIRVADRIALRLRE